MNDVREIRTRSRIKRGMLALLERKSITEITVKELCELAGVSRTSFYKHYKNVRSACEDAIDELINEKFTVGKELYLALSGKKERQIPMCEVMRKDKRFYPIIISEELSALFIDRLSKNIDEDIIRKIHELNGLDHEDIKTILNYQLSGCVNATRNNYNVSDEEWRKKKKLIDQYLKKANQSMR